MSENNKKEEKQLSIYDYEDRYVKRENTRAVKFFLNLVILLVGILIFTCLFFMVEKIYNINKYAGYGAIGVAVIIYIVFFIVPVVKVMKSDYFITNVNRKHAREAKAHNKKVRHNIATKIVDFNAQVEGAGWYDDKEVENLEVALEKNDDKALKDTLTRMYSTSVKKTAKEIISESSLRAGIYSALSQSNTMDATIVAFTDLQMIKDIVFLYGFRPSDAKLFKIYSSVIAQSMVAYGVSSANIGKGLANTMGGIVKSIPILGAAIGAVVDSSIQGLTNGVLTTVVGYQTIKYISMEYHLQDVLDGIELEESKEEVEASIKELETELKDNIKSKAKPVKSA